MTRRSNKNPVYRSLTQITRQCTELSDIQSVELDPVDSLWDTSGCTRTLRPQSVLDGPALTVTCCAAFGFMPSGRLDPMVLLPNSPFAIYWAAMRKNARLNL
jgi:hypothetical protein